MYVSNIQRALDIMYAEIPRAIVIVTGIFDITPLPAFSDGLICDVFQTWDWHFDSLESDTLVVDTSDSMSAFSTNYSHKKQWLMFHAHVLCRFACNCAKRGSQQEGTSKQQKRYIARLEQLINSGRYDRGRKDFTVVWMPHFNEALPPTIVSPFIWSTQPPSIIPSLACPLTIKLFYHNAVNMMTLRWFLYQPGTDEPDRGFFAPDCFHPGRKAHFALATSLWNQLVSFSPPMLTSVDLPTELILDEISNIKNT